MLTPFEGREISIIIATDRKGAIGRDNTIPWKMPSDMAHFKNCTTDRIVVMGRKTAESLGRALPNRVNYVLTRSGKAPFDGMIPVASLEEVLSLSTNKPFTEICIIGGSEIYDLAIRENLVTTIQHTFIDGEVEGADAFAPDSLWDLEGKSDLVYDEVLVPKPRDQFTARIKVFHYHNK